VTNVFTRWAMRAKISMIAANMTACPSVRKPALDAPEPVELGFARDKVTYTVNPNVAQSVTQESLIIGGFSP
jgi:hypothetical protein